MIDTASIKKSVDCRQLIASYLGQPARRSGRTWKWRCPFHEDHTPSLAVYADGWKCYGCDKRGDAIAWLQEREGLSFREAVNRLADGNLPVAALPVVDPKPITAEPPSEEWQEKAMHIVVECEANLWESEAGLKARQWLNNRGLRDATIEKAHIGFNPQDQERHGLFVFRGIIIPHWQESANTLWGLKIRRATGEPKYIMIKGSRPDLFMADTLAGQCWAFICEGEFDSLLLYQEAGDLAAVCTFGSASTHSIDAWLPSLLAIERFYIAGDNDEAGNKMWQYWQRTTKRAMRAAIPAGVNDITDAWKAGVNLLEWTQAALNEKDE